MADENMMMEYYKEEDRLKRKEILLACDDSNSQENVIRMKLWDARYQVRPKMSENTDYFVKGLLELMTESKITINIFNMKHEQKNLNRICEYLCIRDSQWFSREDFTSGELIDHMLYLEYQALASYYIHFSMKDRRYGTTLMGTLAMKETQIIEKLAKDFIAACVITPTNFHMENEFALLKKACFEAFSKEFPDHTKLLE